MFQEKMAGEGNDPDDLIVQAFKAYDNEGKIDSKMFEHALKTWGDKMTKVEEPAPVEEAPEAEPEEDADAQEKKKKKKKAAKKISSFLYFYAKTPVALKKAANYEDSTFHRKEGQYEGIDRPHSKEIVGWYLTLTDISFIINSQFTNKVILLWGTLFRFRQAVYPVQKYSKPPAVVNRKISF